MEALLNFSPAVVVALKRGAGSLSLLSPSLCAKAGPGKIVRASEATRKKNSSGISSERNRAVGTRGVRIMRRNVILQQTFGNSDANVRLSPLSKFCTSIADFGGVAFLLGRLSEEQFLAMHTP